MATDAALRPRKRDVQLRTNFWVVPLAMSGLALVAAVAGVVIDHRVQKGLRHVPVPLRLSANDARTLLATLVGASITVVALVVSLTMVVLSLVATNFGPRIVRNFIRRSSTQLVIGGFIATFVFSLLVLLSVSSGKGETFVPLVSTWLAVAMVLASTSVLVAWVHDLAFSIQIGNTLVDIAVDLNGAILRRSALAPGLLAVDVETCSLEGASPVRAELSGYVQRVDLARLVAIACRVDAVISLAVREGDFVTVRQAVAWVIGSPADVVSAEIARCVLLGSCRTLEDDLEYALAQYVEIALRALSPAVNDLQTGLSCVDWIGDALVRIAALPQRSTGIAEESGRLRLVLVTSSFATAVDAAFNELRRAANGDVSVIVQLLRVIAKVAPHAPGPAALNAIERHVVALARAAQDDRIDSADRPEVDAAVDNARRSLTDAASANS